VAIEDPATRLSSIVLSILFLLAPAHAADKSTSERGETGLGAFIAVDAPRKTKPESAVNQPNSLQKYYQLDLSLISTEPAKQIPRRRIGLQFVQSQEEKGLAPSPRMARTTDRQPNGEELAPTVASPASGVGDLAPRPPLELGLPDLEENEPKLRVVREVPKITAIKRKPLTASKLIPSGYRVPAGRASRSRKGDDGSALQMMIARAYPHSDIKVVSQYKSLVVSGVARSENEALDILSAIRSLRLIPVVDQIKVRR
jgi:hypothetical protein